MKIELRSPLYDREAIEVPLAVSFLSKPFNGTICSKRGDEYPIENNIINLVQEPEDMSLAQSSNHWRITASIYEDLWRKRSLSILSGEDFPIQKEQELLSEWVSPGKDKIYLDVGCSTALYARTLKKKEPGATLVALDFSIQMLEEARLKAEADETDIYFLRADAREMPFFGNTFDGIVMGGTLNELTDELKVLFECRRILKDEGVFFVMHLIKSDTWYGRLLQDSAEWSGIKFLSVEESNDLFKRAGFNVEDQFTKGIVCFTKLRT
jgi:SAM-dependent methyltransferase